MPELAEVLRRTARRGAIVELLDAPRDPALAADLHDIAIFAAGLRARTSPGGREAALAILDEAVAMFGSGAALERERASLSTTSDARGVPPPG